MIGRIAIGAVGLACMILPVAALDQFSLARGGYLPVYEGYAAITTCVHGQDSYDLGPLVFVCDQFTYEYPYHYDNVVLFAPEVIDGVAIGYLCLNDENDCIMGSLVPR